MPTILLIVSVFNASILCMPQTAGRAPGGSHLPARQFHVVVNDEDVVGFDTVIIFRRQNRLTERFIRFEV